MVTVIKMPLIKEKIRSRWIESTKGISLGEFEKILYVPTAA